MRRDTSGSSGSSVGCGTRIVACDLLVSLSFFWVTWTVPGTLSVLGSSIPRAISKR